MDKKIQLIKAALNLDNELIIMDKNVENLAYKSYY